MLEPLDERRRKRLRLLEFDYASPGAYFVTAATRNRDSLLGDIVDDAVVLNVAGAVVRDAWRMLPARFASVMVDEFVIMPNHVHGILWLLDEREVRDEEIGALHGRGAASSAPTLGVVMRAFKSVSAVTVNRCLGRAGQLWQRNYFERVIRNDRELGEIRQYIIDNPAQWAIDEENRAHDELIVRG